MSAVTQWFEPADKPVHVGVYETRTRYRHDVMDVEGGFSYWNGEFWCVQENTKHRARLMGVKHVKSLWPRKTWRGLAEAPK